MTIERFRSVSECTFFKRLGLKSWALERLPNSPAQSIDVIINDRDGMELGRFEMRYDEDGDAFINQMLIPCDEHQTVVGGAKLWL